MAMGQAALSGTLDVGAVDAVESRLCAREQRRGAGHAEALRDALELLGLYDRAGMWLAVPSQLALLWRCSQQRATTVLTCAQVLVELPGAFELLEAAVMTVEQSFAVGRVLDPLPPEVRDPVWAKAVARLGLDVQRGSVTTPARLTDLLRTWAVEVDPDSAVDRRRRAEAQGSVLLWRRADGLNDIVLSGLTAPLADAVLSRITLVADQTGFPGDDRTAGKRRLDAAVDLLLGRTGRPAGECAPVAGIPVDGVPTPTTGAPAGVPTPTTGDADETPGGCAGGCGCPLGAPAPCGASVTVLVPLATALGVGDVPAQQAGAGPLEPDLLAALLASAPVLRAEWTDPDGTPVNGPGRAERPARGDTESVRQALRHLVEDGPGPRQPGHPDDHDPDDHGPDHGPDDDQDPDSEPDGPPGGGRTSRPEPPSDKPAPSEPAPDEPAPDKPPPEAPPPDTARRRPGVLTRPHPPGLLGPYRVPASLRRFLSVRAPRCEWPGCGARAARCDLDHDLAHPYGPTCACNLGPLCRRHHRVKQLGWTKQRTPDGVAWTSPTMRTTLSAPQYLDVPTPRPARTTARGARDELSPAEREDALHPTDPHFDGRDTDNDTDDWVGAERDAEKRWWARQLQELRHDALAPAA